MKWLATIMVMLAFARPSIAFDAMDFDEDWLLARTGDVFDGLIARWTLDVDGTDSVGVWSGTVTDATNAVGKINGSLAFNGTSSTILCNPMTSELSGSFTMSAWVFLFISTADVRQALVSERVAGNYRTCIGIFDNKLSFARYDGVNNPFLNSTANYQTGRWYFLVGTKETTGAMMKLYVDGAYDKETIDTSGTDAYSTLRIGSQTGDRYFPGLIDDVRIYNRALTSNEIARIYNLYK